MALQAFSLPRSLILEVSGRDAARYLHSRLSTDIRALAVGSGSVAAALSAQGKVEGLFYVGRVGADQFILVCDGGSSAEVVAAFRRYIVADRVTVVEHLDYELVHLLIGSQSPSILDAWAPGCTALAPLECVASDVGIVVARRRGIQAGFDLILPRSRGAELRNWIGSQGGRWDDESELRQLRFKAAIPAFPDELSPDRLFSSHLCPEAISFSKGCYVGQEVMEKIAAYGKAPRTLHWFALDGSTDLPIGSRVQVNGQEIGEVCSACADVVAAKVYCFAYVRPGFELTLATVAGLRVVEAR